VASRSEEGPVPALPRCPPRIHPPNPITVAIEDDRGTVIAYGVMADISRGGGCIQTDVLILNGATLDLRLSFAYPPEVHDVVGRIAWARPDVDASLAEAYRCGVEWVRLGYTLTCRLGQLTRETARSGKERRLVSGDRRVGRLVRPASGTILTPTEHALWSPSGPQTQPVATSRRAGAVSRDVAGASLERADILRFTRQRAGKKDQ
jgi:hypothetical protein